MKVLAVINPFAGRGKVKRHLDLLHKIFKDNHIKPEWFVSAYPHHPWHALKEMNLKKYDAVVAIGGDGTLFDTVNGLMHHADKKPLGIIPLGTGNSFIKDLAPDHFKLQDYVALLKEGRLRKIDLGKVYTNKHSFYFINMMGFGFTTDVSIRGMKFRRFGKHAYSLAVLRELFGLKKYPLVMHYENKIHMMNNVFVAISNSRYAGGKFLMAPDAEISDGKLEVLIVNNIGRMELLKTFPKIFSGTHIHHPDTSYFKVSSISFESPGHSKLLAPDGEIIGRLPVKINIVPKILEVFSVD